MDSIANEYSVNTPLLRNALFVATLVKHCAVERKSGGSIPRTAQNLLPFFLYRPP